MPRAEKELRARDAKRDLGQEPLQSVHKMKTERRERIRMIARIAAIAEIR